MASAVCIGFVFISEVSVSTAYSPRLPANIPKGCSINQVFDHKDSQQDISDAHLVDDDLNRKHSRRGFMKTGATAVFPFLMTAALTTPTTRANAFDNRKDDKYADVVPTPGKQPGDLGYSQRSNYFGLKQCGTSPNCWNSSTPKANIPARWLPSWEANGRSIDDVKKIIDTYEVGHDEIDGGGFKVIEYKKKSSDDQYLYVQFQSYKAGYIDDFECWFNPESKKFDVRSSSRVGYSDLGVNALRLEYIASRLEKEYGWTFERRKNGKLV
jgi:uncharacterized protein (DUF1499 family)